MGGSGDALIMVRSVTKVFQTGRTSVQAVDDLSVDVQRGEFVSLVGPSGCGKTTLMMIIGGLIAADRGEVRIHGQTVRGPYTNLGIVFQNAELLEWRTSLQNILLQIEILRIAGSGVCPCRARSLEQRRPGRVR